MLIHQYQPSWESDFKSIKEVILAQIEFPGISIEHVGSTSVRDLAAKPIIDIDIAYDETVTFMEIKQGLAEIGYHHIGDLDIEGREVYLSERIERRIMSY